MLMLFRALGAAILLGTFFILSTGWSSGGSEETIPASARNSPGAYRTYFIVHGGK